MRWPLVVLCACSFAGKNDRPPAGDAAPIEHDAAAPDAAGPDAAAAFDPAKCPAGFGAIGSLPHRYRFGYVPNTNLQTWSAARTRCEQEVAPGGYTAHLVVFDSVTERDAVWNQVAPTQNYMWTWTGVFRSPSGEWTKITGGPATPVWAITEPLQRQGSPIHAIAIGSVDPDPYGDRDLPFDWMEQFICECDGRTVIALP